MTDTFYSPDNKQAQSSVGFIPISLYSLREATNFDVGNIVANGGVLASDTTPILDAINAATDGCQRVLWASSNSDQVVFQTPLPPNLDTDKDIIVHCRIASGGTADEVGFVVSSFFNEGDTVNNDTTDGNQTTTYAEVTATIAAADIPSGAQTLTVGLVPGSHTTDSMAMSAVWIEYTAKSPEVEINGTSRIACRIQVPYAHRVVSAKMFTENMVQVGTLSVTLNQTDPGDARGGAQVGLALDNTTLKPNNTNRHTPLDFVLSDDDMNAAPKNRCYFLTLNATDAADRISEPQLVLEVEPT